VIRLSAALGTEVDVVIQGSDAQQALDVISDFLVDEGLIS
jgi:phosphotransferase system HPr-like phosphotransfer protein